MFFAILLAMIAIGAGYYIHLQFSPAPATPELSIPEGSKREKLAASKRDAVGAVSNRSVYNTAAPDTSNRSVTGGTQTVEKSGVEQPQRDESSRDVKTARTPTPAEHPTYADITGASPTNEDLNNNNVLLVKDSEGGAADPVSKSPAAKTAIISTESERFRGELGNLPDSTARNSSPNPGASNQEVKPDPATASALSEKKKVKKRSSGGQKSPKKSKISKKSKEIKSADGGTSD